MAACEFLPVAELLPLVLGWESAGEGEGLLNNGEGDCKVGVGGCGVGDLMFLSKSSLLITNGGFMLCLLEQYWCIKSKNGHLKAGGPSSSVPTPVGGSNIFC